MRHAQTVIFRLFWAAELKISIKAELFIIES